MDTTALIYKVLCAHNGSFELGELCANICTTEDDLETVLGNPEMFTRDVYKSKEIIVARTKMRLCKAKRCNDCSNLHVCKFYLYGTCPSNERQGCSLSHELTSQHNNRVLREHHLDQLDRRELCTLLLQNDNHLLPPICFNYNKTGGKYGYCPDKESCRRLHICQRYITGTCAAEVDCDKSHDFYEPHPLSTLQKGGVPSGLVPSMLSTYRNINAIRDRNDTNETTHCKKYSVDRMQQSSEWDKSSMPETGYKRGTLQRSSDEPKKILDLFHLRRNEICLFFVKGDCKHGDKCRRVHHKMPYKWEVKKGMAWSPLMENEAIERDFCDPSKKDSEGSMRVRFDSMTCRLDKVRRLSTVSSVLQPTFLLTTEWAWFWENEYGQWVKYASIKEMHRLSSITSEDLEKKYQEDSSAVVKFTAGQQSYELSFRDMTQRNEMYGTVRMVRRRPVFISTADAQAIRSRKNGPRNTSKNFRSVPGFWDKSAIPDNGYKTVTLPPSERDYQKIQGLFNKTMRGFNIVSIERVQNADLWEEFQRKRDKMKKNNGDKNSKELTLFHGTDPKHLDAICKDNFDWRLCGTNGTVYGQGSYFARDAKYSHSFTSQSEQRTMFACRVIVGDYTRGNSELRLPPSKGAGNSSLYDSCVDNVLNPSIYVVFEKNQVYPEFLIKYDDGATPRSSLAPAPMKTVSIQSPSITPTSNLNQVGAATTQPTTVSIQTTSLTPISNLIQVSAATTPLKTAPFTLSPSKTAAFSITTHSFPTSSTVHNPTSTASYTVSSPASTPSYTDSTPASTASYTVSTPASTASYTVSTPASTPSYTVSTPASTPSYTVSSPASTPSYTVSTPASTPSYTVSTPAITPSYTVSTPVSTPSYTVSSPASTPSHTVTPTASTPSYTVSRLTSKRLSPPTPSDIFTTSARNPTYTNPTSIPSYTASTPASERLAPQPPTPSDILTTSARNPSHTLTRSTLSPTTHSVNSTPQPQSSSSSLSTSYDVQAWLNAFPSTSSHSSSMPPRPARNPSTVYSPSLSVLSHPPTSPTWNSSDIAYRAPTALRNRRETNEKNKCLLQ